jgi:hypothetical protein
MRDLQAARNAITEPWSNGQVEGLINKLKTLKRSMYGRAGVGLLRARLIPIESADRQENELSHPTTDRDATPYTLP